MGKYKWIGKDDTVMGKRVLSEDSQLTAVSNRLIMPPHNQTPPGVQSGH